MSGPSFHVLVVEDHPDVAEMMKVMIGMLGHRVSTAGSIAETIDKLKSERFDLLLVDYRLPDGSGSEVLAGRPADQVLPAVLLTAFDEATLSPSMKEGFSMILRKPVDLEQLRSSIQSLCGT